MQTITLNELVLIKSLYLIDKEICASIQISTSLSKDLLLGALEFSVLIKRGKEKKNRFSLSIRTCGFLLY
jgi:hypothetical protein